MRNEAVTRDKRAVCHKQFEAHHKAVTPADPDMEMIRRYAMASTQPDDLAVWQHRLANDQVDRDHERFPLAYLQRFAETLPGKSLMIGHDYTQSPAGRYFDASVVPDAETGGHVLMARFYTRADAPISADIAAGIAREASIGFIPATDEQGRTAMTCDLCGQPPYALNDKGDYLCPHLIGREYEGRTCSYAYAGDTSKVEAVEGSEVWLGAQYGTRTVDTHAAAPFATKAAHLTAIAAQETASGKEDSVDLEQAKAKIAELEAKLPSSEALTKDADVGRAFFKAEIERLYKSMGDEATGLTLLDALKDATAEKLLSVYKAADEKHAKHFAPRLGGSISGVGDAVNASPKSVDEILFGVRAAGGN
jgi:hypothetical protein